LILAGGRLETAAEGAEEAGCPNTFRQLSASDSKTQILAVRFKVINGLAQPIHERAGVISRFPHTHTNPTSRMD